MARNVVAFLGSMLMACGISFGQQNYQAKTFTEDDSLAQDYVNSITQDQRGFLWLGTGKGLSRYDGMKFQNFRQQNGLADNFVTASALDKNGTLFIGHLTGKLSFYNGRKFQTMETGLDAKIVAMATDPGTGMVWAINQAGVLLSLTNGRLAKIESELTRDKVINCLAAHDKKVLIGTSEGLIEITTDGRVIESEQTFSPLEYVNVTALAKSRKGWVWVSTEEGNLFILEQGEIRAFNSGTALENPVHLLEDSQNILWVATKLTGLHKLALDSSLTRIIDVEHLSEAPAQQSPVYLYEDGGGSIWSGSLGEGVRQFIPNQFTVFDLTKAAGAAEVRAAVEIEKNTYWVGTDKGVWIGQYNVVNKIFNWKQHEDKRLAGLDVKNLFRKNPHDSLLWVAGLNQEIFLADLNNLTLKEISRSDSVRGQLNDVERDAAGNFWLSIEGSGVQLLNRDLQGIKTFNTSNGMLHNSISSICIDKDQNVWFGSQATGLFRLLPSGTFEYWTKDGQFPSHSVNDIALNSTGDLWVATDGDGIFQITPDSIYNFNEGNGLLSAFAKHLVFDAQGNIWATHRMGLSMISHSVPGAIRTFGKSYGLANLSDENKAFLEDANGNIWFSQGANFIRYNRYLENPDHLTRKVVFTNLRYFYKEWDFEQHSTDSSNNADGLFHIQLPHDQNHLTFDFVSISLGHKDHIYYKHKLVGLETEWSHATLETSATYTNLSPGRYSIEVIASESPYSWIGKAAVYEFFIEKPYWQRWWFYLSQASFITLFFGLTFFISRRLKNAETHWAVRMLVFALVFILLEYILVNVEPHLEQFQNGAPVFQVLINLVLALLLLPLEDLLKKVFHRESRNE